MNSYRKVDSMLARATAIAAALAAASLASAPAAADFSGPYAAVLAGKAEFPADIDETIVIAAPPSSEEETGDIDPDGLSATLLLGYRMQLHPKLFGGVEADGAVTSSEARYEGFKYEHDGLITVRAVAGYEVTDGLLLFATAGGAWTDLRVHQRGAGTVHDEWLSGWVVGAGGEAELQDFGPVTVAIRGDYLYGNFGGTSFDAEVTPPVVQNPYDVDSEMHHFRLGIVVKPR
jgi:opacity protein-like surface antigen